MGVQRGVRLSPAVTSLASDAPQEMFWHLLGPEADGLAMSAAGQMGEPPGSLCCFRAVGRQAVQGSFLCDLRRAVLSWFNGQSNLV